MTKTVAPKGQFRIQRLIEDEGEFYIGGGTHDEVNFEAAKQYADQQKIADSKRAQQEGGEEFALANSVCFAVTDDTGKTLYVTDFTLGLE